MGGRREALCEESMESLSGESRETLYGESMEGRSSPRYGSGFDHCQHMCERPAPTLITLPANILQGCRPARVDDEKIEVVTAHTRGPPVPVAYLMEKGGDEVWGSDGELPLPPPPLHTCNVLSSFDQGLRIHTRAAPPPPPPPSCQQL